MTISTKILKDLLSDTSVKKAVYYISESRIFLQATEDVIVGEDAIKTPTIDEHSVLAKKLFKRRVRHKSVPLGDALNILYHVNNEDLQDYLEENDFDFLYKEAEYSAYSEVFKKWMEKNNVKIEWMYTEIEQA